MVSLNHFLGLTNFSGTVPARVACMKLVLLYQHICYHDAKHISTYNNNTHPVC